MTGRTICAIDWCSTRVSAEGLCNMHVIRKRKGADMNAPRPARYLTPEESFLARTEPLLWDDHLIWTGATAAGGYGRISIGGRAVPAHRYSYEREYGPIPDGMVPDHICHILPCVEPTHLRPATPQQNNWNRKGPNPVNASGWRGVQKRGNSYAAHIDIDGKRVSLGSYRTGEEAGRVAHEARKKHRGEFAGKPQ